MAEYSEISDPMLQARITTRYQIRIASLQGLGFHLLAYCLETLGPYSAIFNLPVLVLSFTKEVIVFSRPLRFGVGNVLLASSDPPSIALCMGMGVKIYSAFPDGTILITSDFKTHAHPRPGSAISRLFPFNTVEEAWRAHRARLLAGLPQGTPALEAPSFRDYIAMSHKEEDLSQYY